jgi:hypothetical protein
VDATSPAEKTQAGEILAVVLVEIGDVDGVKAVHPPFRAGLLETQLKGKSISTGNTSEEDDAEIKCNTIRAYLGMVEI